MELVGAPNEVTVLLASMAACSVSTPCSTPGEQPVADKHPMPGEHEHQQLASTPWLTSTRVRDGEESHRLHNGETKEREEEMESEKISLATSQE
jgi:hypothetical protein